MSPRGGALRRRRKPSLATRLRILWVFIALIAGAAAYGAYVLVTLPALRVAAVDVRIDGITVTERSVLAAAHIDRSSNVWLLDTGEIQNRIEALPYVDAAVVRRVPPARLVIDVTEREPAACVRSGTQLVTVDATQRILQSGCARASVVTVVVRGEQLGAPGTTAQSAQLGELLADARALTAAKIAVRTVSDDRFGQLVAVERNGIALLFGSDADVDEKAKLVAPVLAAAPPGRPVRAVDLRAPATPTIQFK